MIETHYHLDQLPDPDAALDRWFSQGLQAVVAPSMGMDSLEKTLAIAARWPGRVFPAAGLHPERLDGADDAACLAEARALCRWIRQHKERVCAIGEIGLPYYALQDPTAPPEAALEVLALFLETARETGLPVILHAVHTMAALCLALLRRTGVCRGVFHWLKAPEDVTRAIVQAGFAVSVTPEVTTLPRDRRLASLVPTGQLLVETDGPYPLRVPMEGIPSPLWSRRSVQLLAGDRQLPAQELERQLDANATALFGLSQPETAHRTVDSPG